MHLLLRNKEFQRHLILAIMTANCSKGSASLFSVQVRRLAHDSLGSLHSGHWVLSDLMGSSQMCKKTSFECLTNSATGMERGAL